MPLHLLRCKHPWLENFEKKWFLPERPSWVCYAPNARRFFPEVPDGNFKRLLKAVEDCERALQGRSTLPWHQVTSRVR
jgi:hypothetical protein